MFRSFRLGSSCFRFGLVKRVSVCFVGGFQKGGFQKGGFGGCSPGTKTGTRVRSPKPPFWKPPFYLPVTLVGGFQKRGFQKGGFGGCSPGTKTGTRARSPKPPFCETALLSPSDPCAPVSERDGSVLVLAPEERSDASGSSFKSC